MPYGAKRLIQGHYVMDFNGNIKTMFGGRLIFTDISGAREQGIGSVVFHQGKLHAVTIQGEQIKNVLIEEG